MSKIHNRKGISSGHFDLDDLHLSPRMKKALKLKLSKFT